MPTRKPRVVSHGQVSAPIELFVAVIILTMSMALAFTVIQQSTENRCLAELKNNMRGLESAIVDVAVGSPPTTREFAISMPVCQTRAVDGVRLAYYGEAQYCQACPGQYGGCWKLEPISRDSQGFVRPLVDASVCINIPAKIVMQDEHSDNPECAELSDTPCPLILCKGYPTMSAVQCATDDPTYAACLEGKTSLIPKSLWNVDDYLAPPSSGGIPAQGSVFQTISKNSTRGSYVVRMQKGVASAASGAAGVIRICVKQA